MIKILLADRHAVCASESDRYRLSGARIQKADEYRAENARLLSIAAGLLLDDGLKAFGYREKDMTYGYGEYGKPYFANAPHVRFNLSHSGPYVMAALSNTCGLGCDVQTVRQSDLRAAERVFAPEELAVLKAETDDPDGLFTRLWAKRESLVKALGSSILLAPRADETGFAFRGFALPGAYACVCAENAEELKAARCVLYACGGEEELC